MDEPGAGPAMSRFRHPPGDVDDRTLADRLRSPVHRVAVAVVLGSLASPLLHDVSGTWLAIFWGLLTILALLVYVAGCVACVVSEYAREGVAIMLLAPFVAAAWVAQWANLFVPAPATVPAEVPTLLVASIAMVGFFNWGSSRWAEGLHFGGSAFVALAALASMRLG